MGKGYKLNRWAIRIYSTNVRTSIPQDVRCYTHSGPNLSKPPCLLTITWLESYYVLGVTPLAESPNESFMNLCLQYSPTVNYAYAISFIFNLYLVFLINLWTSDVIGLNFSAYDPNIHKVDEACRFVLDRRRLDILFPPVNFVSANQLICTFLLLALGSSQMIDETPRTQVFRLLILVGWWGKESSQIWFQRNASVHFLEHTLPCPWWGCRSTAVFYFYIFYFCFLQKYIFDLEIYRNIPRPPRCRAAGAFLKKISWRKLRADPWGQVVRP